MIDSPSGAPVRLGDVADVRVAPAASVIRHDGVKRYIDVVADVSHRDLAAVAADINQRLTVVKFPLESYAKVLGDYAAPQDARNHLIILSCIAAASIFFLLQAAFGSWRLAAILFLAIPAVLMGGLLAAIATDGAVLSLGTFSGLLAVFGMAVCTNITLIRHYQRLATTPGPIVTRSKVAEFHFAERARSIVTPAIATSVALLPALYLGDVPGMEIIRPMAIVTLGGLVTSTLFTLFAVPVLFLLFGSGRSSDFDEVDLTQR